MISNGEKASDPATAGGPPPGVGPVPDGAERPFWSVMIPTYRPTVALAQALRSVLDQDPGAGAMQVAVVDDASPGDEAGAILRGLPPGRVELHRQPSNVGLAGNWNACLRLARGHWVHILHQDDFVLPGFYERLGRAARENPGVGSIFCRHRVIDSGGGELYVSEPEREGAGVPDDWLRRIASWQRIQCPAVVVRRDVYEDLGGFRPDLCFALDWEMWVRIAARYPVWYEPEVLACYRAHDDNETARLGRDGRDVEDLRRGLAILGRHLPGPIRAACRREALRQLGRLQLIRAARLLQDGRSRAGLALACGACRLAPSVDGGRTLLAYGRWAAKNWVAGLARSRRRSHP